MALAPRHPIEGDKEDLERYKRDLIDFKQNPQKWGVRNVAPQKQVRKPKLEKA